MNERLGHSHIVPAQCGESLKPRPGNGFASPAALRRPAIVYTQRLPRSAMKLNLATRLFAAVLSTAVVVAVAMGVGAPVNLNRDFLGF